MPRSVKERKAKPIIYVFCEGESEQVYTDFLKNTFSDIAVVKRPSSTGLFEEAQNKFSKDKRFRDNAEVTNEIWFFFDIETDQRDKWDSRYKIIKKLRKLRKDQDIKVRLLMTTACIEYWLMLHYKKYSPVIETTADKERILHELQIKEKSYKKGDVKSTFHIAENYQIAVKNAKDLFRSLLKDGLPDLIETDERDKWLYTCSKTFTTVFEAIEFLESLRE